MNILQGDLNAEVGRKHIFKPTIGNESFHEINNYNTGIGKITTSKTSQRKVRCSHIATSVNILGHLQMGKP
jgi:hypothetical protein